LEEKGMAKDYYVILGIDPDATQDEIRAAYRRRAKACHPDSSGEDSEPFLALGEAYEVLGDPGRRRDYDDEVAREKRRARRTIRWAGPDPLHGRGHAPEPLIPTQPPGPRRGRYGEPTFSSLVEELLRGSRRQGDAPFRPEARAGEAGEIQVQVRLTREQALHGGRIRMWLPVQMRCPGCRGRGWIAFSECPDCLGSGLVAAERAIEVAFPGGVVDGSEAMVSLEDLGRGDLALRLRFRVDAW
jgi:DnaJ-class molecular chaperone